MFKHPSFFKVLFYQAERNHVCKIIDTPLWGVNMSFCVCTSMGSRLDK